MCHFEEAHDSPVGSSSNIMWCEGILSNVQLLLLLLLLSLTYLR